MGFDLVPRNRDAKSFHANIWTWPLMLQDTGMAGVLNLEFLPDGQYRYIPDRKGNSPLLNDGYYVSAVTAREMVRVADEWLRTHEDYNLRDEVLRFIAFAENSRGFWIR